MPNGKMLMSGIPPALHFEIGQARNVLTTGIWQYETKTDLPEVGNAKYLYYVTDEEALYIWDAAQSQYMCCGGDVKAILEELKRVNHNTYKAGDGIKFDEVAGETEQEKTITISAEPYKPGSGITISAQREISIAAGSITDEHIKSLNATKLFLNEEDVFVLDGGKE